jgi:NAD(P)-dependent dehydrogenase (short-subunit alcohol dehydrogenase family)
LAQGKVWFITGASRGFGRVWTEAALERGDKIVATARKPEALADLVGRYGDAVLALALDVTDAAAVSSTVQRGFEHFGRLDVVVSNAGYGQIGMIEETEIQAARRNFETNFFGTLSVIKAVLPLLREQGSGHVIPVSSGAGLVSFPMGGIYGATKYAVNGLADSLSQEVAQFGIKVTIVEPGPFATDFSTNSLTPLPMGEYDALRAQMFAAHGELLDPSTYPDPKSTIAPLLRVIDMDRPPLHLLLGHKLLPMVEQIYANRLETLREGAALST